MIKKQPEVKTINSIMKENRAVFSLNLSYGFANISFDDKLEMVVEFLNDDGYNEEDMEIPLKDIDQVSNFMKEMKELRLKDFTS